MCLLQKGLESWSFLPCSEQLIIPPSLSFSHWRSNGNMLPFFHEAPMLKKPHYHTRKNTVSQSTERLITPTLTLSLECCCTNSDWHSTAAFQPWLAEQRQGFPFRWEETALFFKLERGFQLRKAHKDFCGMDCAYLLDNASWPFYTVWILQWLGTVSCLSLASSQFVLFSFPGPT